MKFWKKLKYWQKSTLIGFMMGILICTLSLILLILFGTLPKIFQEILRPLGTFTYNYFFTLNDYYCFSHRFFYDIHNPISYICGFSTFVGYFLIFGVIGGLIGVIIGKLKDHKKVKSKHK